MDEVFGEDYAAECGGPVTGYVYARIAYIVSDLNRKLRMINLTKQINKRRVEFFRANDRKGYQSPR